MFRIPVFMINFCFFSKVAICHAGEIAGNPALSSYDRNIILQGLILLWLGIIGLIIIIAMKLKEAKRIEDMDIHKDDKDAPFLDYELSNLYYVSILCRRR